jgi:hypothetical protein
MESNFQSTWQIPVKIVLSNPRWIPVTHKEWMITVHRWIYKDLLLVWDSSHKPCLRKFCFKDISLYDFFHSSDYMKRTAVCYNISIKS